jgi:hypothetical protein
LNKEVFCNAKKQFQLPKPARTQNTTDHEQVRILKRTNTATRGASPTSSLFEIEAVAPAAGRNWNQGEQQKWTKCGVTVAEKFARKNS